MALLEVSNLSKDFGGLRAVSDLSFVLNQGEILGLIGPNGAGKTTVFNLMSGFLEPLTGSVRLDGHELVGLRPNAIVKRGVARTFQIVKPFRKLTVLENVVLAAFLHEPKRVTATAEARRILAMLDLHGEGGQLRLRPDIGPAEATGNRPLRCHSTRRSCFSTNRWVDSIPPKSRLPATWC